MARHNQAHRRLSEIAKARLKFEADARRAYKHGCHCIVTKLCQRSKLVPNYRFPGLDLDLWDDFKFFENNSKRHYRIRLATLNEVNYILPKEITVQSKTFLDLDQKWIAVVKFENDRFIGRVYLLLRTPDESWEKALASMDEKIAEECYSTARGPAFSDVCSGKFKYLYDC